MAERTTTKTKAAAAKKPAARRTPRKAAQEAAAAAQALEQKMKNSHIGGFAEFIREQGVGLAFGLAIGTAAGDTVKKLVQGFISPVVQFIVGSQKGLEAASTHIEIAGRSADFAWGAFVSSLITLVATAFVIYLIIHFLKLDRLDKKKD